MNSVPLISVITIVYNDSGGLARTINSVLSQSYCNFQYIIIDGGSTDGTLDIINKYIDNVDVFVTGPDKGISDAFNKGISLAKGEIVGIINSGDIIYKDALTKVSEKFCENHAVDYVYGNSILKDVVGNEIRRLTPVKHDFPYSGMPFQHSALYLKKTIYDRVGGYNINYANSMDFELLLRIYRFGYIGCYVDADISSYYRGGVSDLTYYRGYLEVMASSLVCTDVSISKIIYSFIVGISKTFFRKIIEKYFLRNAS